MVPHRSLFRQCRVSVHRRPPPPLIIHAAPSACRVPPASCSAMARAPPGPPPPRRAGRPGRGNRRGVGHGRVTGRRSCPPRAPSCAGTSDQPRSLVSANTTALDRLAWVSSVQVRTFLAGFPACGCAGRRPGDLAAMRIAAEGVARCRAGRRLGTPAIVSGRGFLSGSDTIRSDVGAPPMDSHQVV